MPHTAMHMEHGSQSVYVSALLDEIPKNPLEYALPKSSQARYFPASPAMEDHDLAAGRPWSFPVGLAVWEVVLFVSGFQRI